MTNDRPEGGVAGAAYLIHAFAHRAYPLSPERVLTIGRDTTSDIVVNEVSVSRRHVELHHDGGEYILHAIGSTPTSLNDTPVVTPQLLREGDTFLVGTMRFVFTRSRLPVAMAIAQAAPSHLASGVDERRPTLTFARQEQVAASYFKQWKGVGIVALIVLALLGFLVLYRPL